MGTKIKYIPFKNLIKAMKISLLPKTIRKEKPHKIGFTISKWFIEALKSIHEVSKD